VHYCAIVVRKKTNMKMYQLLPCLFPDPGGGGGEVDAGEELLAGRTGERRNEVVEAKELSCTRT
jgi:hypothetical protein